MREERERVCGRGLGQQNACMEPWREATHAGLDAKVDLARTMMAIPWRRERRGTDNKVENGGGAVESFRTGRERRARLHGASFRRTALASDGVSERGSRSHEYYTISSRPTVYPGLCVSYVSTLPIPHRTLSPKIASKPHSLSHHCNI